MIDHVGLAVSGYERSREFYRSVLAPLGGELVMEVTAEQTGDGSHAGFGSSAMRVAGRWRIWPNDPVSPRRPSARSNARS